MDLGALAVGCCRCGVVGECGCAHLGMTAGAGQLFARNSRTMKRSCCVSIALLTALVVGPRGKSEQLALQRPVHRQVGID